MGLILRTSVLTDLGLRRTNNEDAAYAGYRLLAVADGMGGLPAGELASELAIRALVRLDQPPGAGRIDGGGNPNGGYPNGSGPGRATEISTDVLLGALREAFDEGSAAIRAAASEDAVRDGMGTTVTALLFDGDRAALMHIGDSRGYLFRGGQLIRLTKDDTFVQALVDQGVLTAEAARNHPQRALVTKAMQGLPIAPSSAVLGVRPGDVFLLCSDGLSDVVADDVIACSLATRGSLDDCAASLVAAAIDGGGPDNITVLLAEADFD